MVSAFKILKVGFGIARAALGPLISSVWSFTAALLANPVTWIVIGIVALVAAIVLLYDALSPATIISYFNTLSSALNCAVDWKIIKENPATSVKLPSNTGKRAPYFDKPEARRLLECLST